MPVIINVNEEYKKKKGEKRNGWLVGELTKARGVSLPPLLNPQTNLMYYEESKTKTPS